MIMWTGRNISSGRENRETHVVDESVLRLFLFIGESFIICSYRECLGGGRGRATEKVKFTLQIITMKRRKA